RVFLEAAAANNGQVVCRDGRARRIGCVSSVVEVPSGEGVECDDDPGQSYGSSERSAHSDIGEAVNVDVLERNVRGLIVGEDSPSGEVVDRGAGIAVPRIRRTANQSAL